MLKKIAFIIMILGISALLVLLTLPAKEFENLDEINIGEKVVLEGKVETEKDFGDFKIWNIGGVEVVCDCAEGYLGKEIEIEGVVEEFNGKRQIRVLKINISD